jgi:hypothetical protein
MRDRYRSELATAYFINLRQARYGTGKVTSLSGDGKKRIATIDFPDLGEKRIRLAFSNLRAV